MPDKRPYPLKIIEHPEVGVIPTVSGANREFYSVNRNRQAITSLLCLRQQTGYDFDLRPSLPTDCLGCDLDESHPITPVQFCRQRCKVWEANTQRLGDTAVNQINGLSPLDINGNSPELVEVGTGIAEEPEIR